MEMYTVITGEKKLLSSVGIHIPALFFVSWLVFPSVLLCCLFYWE